MEKIEIGKIVKSQGIKGDVKVIVFADDNFDFASIKNVFIGDQPAKIERVYPLGGAFGVKFSVISTRNEAELYRDKLVYANKEDIKILENQFFIADLLGSEVVLSTGEVIGKMYDVQNFGSADVFYIKKDNKFVLCSHIEGLIKKHEGEKLVLDAEIFKKVAVYEDWYFNLVSWNVYAA